jgi:spore germination protein
MRTRWLTALLVAGLVLAGGWGLREYNARLATEHLLEASFQRSFHSLITHMENLDLALSKSLVSGSQRQNIIMLTNIWHEANEAQEALAGLPFRELDLTNVQRYLAQVGDYAHTLAEQHAQGRGLDDQAWENLARFYRQTEDMARRLHDVQERVQGGGLARSTLALAGMVLAAPPDLKEGFQEIGQQIDGLPTLIYDGPFSDHVEVREPRALTGEQITAERARQIAKNFADKTDQVDYEVRDVGQAEGKIEAWRVSLTPGNAGNSHEILVDVSKKGGHVLWLINNRDVGQRRLDYDEALQRAKDFLAERGFASHMPTGSVEQENNLFFVFADVRDGVVVYPDQIKVAVALDDGQVVAFDATNHFMAHHERFLPAPGLSQAEIRDRVNPKLDVERIRLAIIPLPSLREVFCYEVLASLNDDKFLIYLDAQTGEEELIQKVIETEGGTVAL